MWQHSFTREAANFDDREMARCIWADQFKCYQLAEYPVSAVCGWHARIGDSFEFRVKFNSIFWCGRDEFVDVLLKRLRRRLHRVPDGMRPFADELLEAARGDCRKHSAGSCANVIVGM